MGRNYAGDAGIFLIETLMGLLVLIVLLRFILQTARADFYNPISQFLAKITDPFIRPAQRIIPRAHGIDLATAAILLLLQVLKLYLLAWAQGHGLAPAGAVVLAAGELLSLAVYVYFFAIIIQVVVSWVNPGAHNPIISIIHQVTEPVMRPFRRLIPPISGLDLSPIAALIALQLVLILLVAPIRDLGWTMAAG